MSTKSAGIIPQKAALIELPEKADRIRRSYCEAMRLAGTATKIALECGQQLREARDLTGANFSDWLVLNCPEVNPRTAYRWMEMAERCVQQVGAERINRLLQGGDGAPVALSAALGSEEAGLPAGAQEARQLLFDFIQDKTICQVLARVAVNGDDPVALTRAANGKRLGGGTGPARDDWPGFIGRRLSDLSSHFEKWPRFSAGQMEVVGARIRSAVSRWPTPVLETFAAEIAREMKGR